MLLRADFIPWEWNTSTLFNKCYPITIIRSDWRSTPLTRTICKIIGETLLDDADRGEAIQLTLDNDLKWHLVKYSTTIGNTIPIYRLPGV